MNIYSVYENEINKYYQVVDVTQGGIDFILERLRYGRTLSNLVARYIPIENGKIETFVHRSVERNKLIQFERGYISRDVPKSLSNFPEDDSKRAILPEMDFFVLPTIQKFLAESKQNICILEDIDGSPDNPWLTTSEPPPLFTFCDADVYFYIDEEEPTIATIRETFSMASAPWSTLAFLTSVPVDVTSLKTNQKVDMKSLDIIAKRTKKIVISAYDGEGYLIWSLPPPKR